MASTVTALRSQSVCAASAGSAAEKALGRVAISSAARPLHGNTLREMRVCNKSVAILTRAREIPMAPTYSNRDLQKIAAALQVPTNIIREKAGDLEEAALWYRRTEQNPLPKKAAILRGRADQIAKAARKLLKHLGIDDPRNAPDGPGATWILELLTYSEAATEDGVVRATERIGRLAEIVEGIRATKEIEGYASKAPRAIQELADAIGIKGHRGDMALEVWLGMTMTLYREITGDRPMFNVGASGSADEGIAGGKFIGFLEAAGSPLGIELSSEAWRSRARIVLSRSPKQK